MIYKTDLKRLTKYSKCYKMFFRNTNISRKLKLRLKITMIVKSLTYTSEIWILTDSDRK